MIERNSRVTQDPAEDSFLKCAAKKAFTTWMIVEEKQPERIKEAATQVIQGREWYTSETWET